MSLRCVAILLVGLTGLAACSEGEAPKVGAVPPTTVGVVSAPGVAVKSGDTIDVHYTLTLEDGDVVETTRDGEPQRLVIGDGQLLPAFEQALTGMRAGEKKSIVIPAQDAYGPHREGEGMIRVLDRASMPHNLDLTVGMQLNATVTRPEAPEEAVQVPVTVTGLTDETVTIDANHPMAGKDLHFEIQVMAIL